MSRARSPRPKRLRSRGAIARRSRCCSPISSAFCGSTACACEARAALSSSLRWQPSLRTCAGSPSLWPDRRQLHPSRALRERHVRLVAPTQPPTIRGKYRRPLPKSPTKIGGTAKCDFCNKIGHNLTHAVQQTASSFDHLVGEQLEREREGDAKLLSSLEVDHALKLGWLQHR